MTTRKMSAWAASLQWEDLPEEVQHRAIASVRDSTSVMFGGANCDAARLAADFARKTAGTVPLAAGGFSDLSGGAFANGSAAASLDYEDGHRLGGAIHPGGITLAAALASSTPTSTVGDLLTATVAGYEVGLRAAGLLWPQFSGDWYHCTGTSGTLAAATASASMRGLSEDGHFRTLVIAWSHAPMATFALPMMKEAIGWGASTGATAAALAEAGFMKLAPDYNPLRPALFPATPFDRPGVEDDDYIQSIGSTYEILNTYFKRYAACAYTHAAAHGLGTLMASGLVADQITSIVVGTHEGALFLDDQTPMSLEHAQYSFPFVLAAVAVDGAAGQREIAEGRLSDERRRAFAGRVTVEHDSDMDREYPEHYGSRLRVHLRDGTVREETFLDTPAPNEEELHDKWMSLLSPRLSPADSESLLEGLADPGARLDEVMNPAWFAKGSG